MVQILNGKLRSQEILDQLKKEIALTNIHPGLAVILIGDNEASRLYVSIKEKRCHEVGIDFHKYLLPTDCREKNILDTINFLNHDESVHGIVVQLPLPNKFDTEKIINSIDPKKDADGFHPENLELIQKGKTFIVPPLISSILDLINQTKENIAGKKAIVMANSETIYLPLEKALEKYGVKTEFHTAEEKNLGHKTKLADILIVAVGRPKFITKNMVKKNSIIIDVGTNKINSKTIGDVDPEVDKICAYRSPVPGGVGPLTVAYLLFNVLKLSKI
jgi:methylenetetrahydrofolate dehydrogenase (NADP+)/methenyltetrahydrofolate cyclohydrolase